VAQSEDLFGRGSLPGDGVLAQAVVQVHVVEGSDAAAELAILANLPGDEQGTKNTSFQSFYLSKMNSKSVSI